MPTLPSGARLWLSMEAILHPGRLFHPCPPDRFWFRDLDPLAGWIGDEDDPMPPERWTTGIVPETRLDAAAFVRVLIAGPRDAERRWHGDWLLTLEQPRLLTDEDWDATLEFLGTDRTLAFLDLALDRCRRQASERRVHADLGDFGPPVRGRADLRSRLLRAMLASDRLGDEMEEATARGDASAELRIRSILERLADAAERITETEGPDRGLAHRVVAAANARLGHVDTAVEHAHAYAMVMPGDDAFDRAIERRLRTLPSLSAR